MAGRKLTLGEIRDILNTEIPKDKTGEKTRRRINLRLDQLLGPIKTTVGEGVRKTFKKQKETRKVIKEQQSTEQALKLFIKNLQGVAGVKSPVSRVAREIADIPAKTSGLLENLSRTLQTSIRKAAFPEPTQEEKVIAGLQQQFPGLTRREKVGMVFTDPITSKRFALQANGSVIEITEPRLEEFGIKK